MSDKQAPGLDPMRAWRDWFVSVEQQWSENLTTLMKDERVARTMGKEFEASLHQHKMFAEAIGQVLASVNLPSREDVLNLGERMGKLEDGLASLQAEFVRLRASLAPAHGGDETASTTSPPRTRRPPAKG